MGGRQLETPVQVKVLIHNQLTTYENSGSRERHLSELAAVLVKNIEKDQ